MKKLVNILASAAMVFALAGCGDPKPAEGDKPAADGVSGTFEGTAKGHVGDVKVEVTLENNKITDVEVKEHEETAGISDNALEVVPKEIKDKQSLNVDTVASATETSNAIIEATKAALESSGVDMANFEK